VVCFNLILDSDNGAIIINKWLATIVCYFPNKENFNKLAAANRIRAIPDF